MDIQVKNTKGHVIPFSQEKFISTLVGGGIDVSSATEYARAVQAFLSAELRDNITTGQLSAFVEKLLELPSLLVASKPSMRSEAPNHALHRLESEIFPAYFDPPLEGIIPQRGPFVRQIDVLPGESLSFSVPNSFFDRAKDAILASEQLRRRLIGKSFEVVAMQVIRGPNSLKREPTSASLTIYNYTDDNAIDVVFGFHDLQIYSVTSAHYQPPLSPIELDRAFQLAMSDEKIAEWNSPQLVATGIQVTEQGVKGEKSHRQVLVLFGAIQDTSAQFWCLVDLSIGKVREIDRVRK